MNKPETHWYELLNNEDAILTMELLANRDFRVVLEEIIKNQITVVTVPSLCNRCKIENPAELENVLNNCKLFTRNRVEIDGEMVSIYELMQGQRLFLLFAALTYAMEYSKYEDNYSGYSSDGSYFWA